MARCEVCFGTGAIENHPSDSSPKRPCSICGGVGFVYDVGHPARPRGVASLPITTEDRLRVRCEALEALLVAKDRGRPRVGPRVAAGPSQVQQSSGPAWDLTILLDRQRAFSERAFGPSLRTQMITDHIRKELAEIEAKPSDVEEWIDVVLMGLDGAWRCAADVHLTSQYIASVLWGKLAKNEKRTWLDWRTMDTTKAPHHIEEPWRTADSRASGEGLAIAPPTSTTSEPQMIPRIGYLRIQAGDKVSVGTDAGDQMIIIRRPIGPTSPGDQGGSIAAGALPIELPPFTKDELTAMAEGLTQTSNQLHGMRHDANRDGRHGDASDISKEASQIEALALKLRELAEKAT